MSAAEKAAANLYPMADYSALAMLTNGRDRLNCTLEAVERVPCPGGDQLESLVVFITANFAFRHLAPPLLTATSRSVKYPFQPEDHSRALLGTVRKIMRNQFSS